MDPKDKANTTTETATSTETAKPVEGAIPDSEGLSAGFRKVRGETPPTDQSATEEIEQVEEVVVEKAPTAAAPEKTATEKPAAEKPAAVEKVAKPVEEPIVLAGLTEKQLKAALANAGEVETLKKTITDNDRKAQGRIGEILQVVKELKAGGGAAGQPRVITKELLKKLNADGYEELAAALAEDLSSILTTSPASTIDAEALEKKISGVYDRRLDELNRETERKLLTIRHADWPQVWASDEFKVWKATLPEEARVFLAQSWDSVGLGKALDEFKAWQAKAVEKPNANAEATKDRKKKRLEGAVTPSGVDDGNTPSVLPDKAGLAAGFKKVRPGPSGAWR